MNIEQEISALEVLRNKLKILPTPQIEYLFEYSRLFENILTKQEEGVFLENLEEENIIELDAIYDDEQKNKVLVGRKIKINTNKFNNHLREIDKKYLGEIGEFDPRQIQGKPILGKELLKKLAIEIGNIRYFKNKENFHSFLLNCEVDKRFFYKPLSNIFDVIYPCSIYSASNIYNTCFNPAPKPKLSNSEDIPEYRKGSCGELFRILSYYSYSKNRDKKILFGIIGRATEPLLFKEEEESVRFEDKLNKYLKYAGYKIENGTIEKSDDKYIIPNIIKTLEEKERGYLFINEQKIPIGTINSAKFQLLKSLCDPIGKAKSLEHLFEKVEMFTRKKTGDVSDKYLGEKYKKRKIEGIIKELQRTLTKYKVSKKFKFTTDDSKCWLYYK